MVLVANSIDQRCQFTLSFTDEVDVDLSSYGKGIYHFKVTDGELESSIQVIIE